MKTLITVIAIFGFAMSLPFPEVVSIRVPKVYPTAKVKRFKK